MIITRAPLRISLGGGGTDLASYYKKYGGFCISAAIDKYIYITIHDRFIDELVVKYSKMERVPRVGDLSHPIIKEALYQLSYKPDDSPGLEIVSIADIPAGTGLGSSGSFTSALLKALHQHAGLIIQPHDLAELACKIEIDILGEPIGKQDQYIASYGGINTLTFNNNGNVDVSPVPISKETLYNLEDNLLLFFTGYSRNASSVLEEQKEKTLSQDKDMIENLHTVKEMGMKSLYYLTNGDLQSFAELMNVHWEIKKHRSGNMTNSAINNYYNIARENGAVGAKVVGAGGGGFLLCYADDHARLRHAMIQAGLKEVRFKFDFEGTKVII